MKPDTEDREPPPLPQSLEVSVSAPNTTPDLQDVLFTDTEEATQDLPAAPPPPPVDVAPVGAWPASVPGHEAALHILMEPSSAKYWEAVTSAVLAALTDVEKVFLNDDPLPDEFDALRKAVVFQWRLAAMLATAPKGPDARVDQPALEAALAEGDLVLANLKPPEGLDAATTAGFDSARATVARDIVSLAELTNSLKPPEPAPAAEEPAAKGAAARTGTARMLSVQNAQRKERNPVALYVVLGAVALGAAGFHGYRFYVEHQPAKPLPPTAAGVPEGTLGVKAPGSPMMTFSTPDGRPLPPDKLEKLRQEAEAAGKVVKEMSPGVYLVGPEPKPGAPNAPAGH